MKTLEQLREDILADGVIDAGEVKELEAVLFADGKIDADEAELLFDLNNGVSGEANHPSWEPFFIKAISSYLLDDEASTGEIDENEAKWLYDKINGDGETDEVEKNLLLHLQAKSKNFPDILKLLLD